MELASKAVRAFGDDTRYEVFIKCHPMVDAKQVANQLGELAQQDNVRFVEQPVGELIPSVDLLLYRYTSTCFEAMQHGVVPIFIRSESFLNIDQLEVAPDVRWVATTPGDLRRIAAEIMRMSTQERRRWRNKASDVVRAALAPVGPESVDAFLL